MSPIPLYRRAHAHTHIHTRTHIPVDQELSGERDTILKSNFVRLVCLGTWSLKECRSFWNSGRRAMILKSKRYFLTSIGNLSLLMLFQLWLKSFRRERAVILTSLNSVCLLRARGGSRSRDAERRAGTVVPTSV